MVEDTAGEDWAAGEEDIGVAGAGADEDMVVGVAGDTGVDVSLVFYPRDILSLST